MDWQPSPACLDWATDPETPRHEPQPRSSLRAPRRCRPFHQRPCTGRQLGAQPADLQPGHRSGGAPGATGQRGRCGVRRGRGASGLPGLGRCAALAPRAGDVQVPGAAAREQGRAGRHDHGRTWQGLHRRAGRGGARHRHRRIRLRCTAAAQGRFQRPGLGRHGQLDPAPAARCGGRHHPLQLPLHGAHVDGAAGPGDRQLLHPEAQRT